MITRAQLLTALTVAGLTLAGCSRIPACGDPEALTLATSQFKTESVEQLKDRFKIPFLNAAATQTLAEFFGPDSVALSDMRAVSQEKDLKLRECTAKADLSFQMEGRVDRAKAALEHGAISGQSVAYMLDGEPYLSAVRKMAPHVTMQIAYSVQRTDDGHLHVEVQKRELPLF